MADELATGLDAGTAPAAPDAAPTPIELSDTSFIKVPGLDKPVAYKDYISGFVPKSDLTRMRQQDAATLRQREDSLKQQEAQLTRASQQLVQRLGPPNAGQPDPLAELRAAPYVDGKVVANLVDAMRTELGRRDQAMNLMHQQMQQMSHGFTSLQGRSRQADTQALFEQTRQKLGLSDNPDVKAFIESEYLSHDGWDTVSADERLEHLSTVVKRRYDALNNVFKTDQQKRVDDARKRPVVPQAPTNPRMRGAAQGAGAKPAEQMANELWALMNPTGQT